MFIILICTLLLLYKMEIKDFFILLFLLTVNLNNVNSHSAARASPSEVDLTISTESDEFYSHDLDNIEENGKFHIIIELNQSSKTSLYFGYDVCCSSIVSRSDIENNQSEIGPKHLINGTINPGETIRIDHLINQCISDVALGIQFHFNRILNETVYVSIDIVIEDIGNDSCRQGGFETPVSFSFPLMLILVMLFILIIFYIIYKRFE